MATLNSQQYINKCETLDDENHFFLNCKLNEHLRKAFLSDFDNTNNTNLLEIILNKLRRTRFFVDH
jgi:hypothetical protein